MFEHKREALLNPKQFWKRILRHGLTAFLMVAFALSLGVLGYHFIGQLPWIDSLLNASMILGGMGPVDPLKNDPAKLFASFYALFSGLAFIAVASVIVAPFAHRLIHMFHLEDSR